MAHNLTEVDEFSTNVTVVDDGDLGTAANLNAAHQALANRTLFLKNKAVVGVTTDNGVPRFNGVAGALQTSDLAIEDDGSLSYITAKSRTVDIGLACCQSIESSAGAPDWYYTTGNLRLASRANNAVIYGDIRPFLPTGAVITAIAAHVKPAVARVAGSRMKIRLIEVQVADGLGVYTGPQPEDDGTANAQLLTSSGLSRTVALGLRYVIELAAGSDGATNQDSIFNVRITYTDPGPRNY